MTPLPRFSTVPLSRCEETDNMVRKDAVLPVQPMVFYALGKNYLSIWSALHTDYPLKFSGIKETGWATFQVSHEVYPDISRNTWQARVVVTFFSQTGCGQPSYALAFTFASYLDPTSPFPLPCAMKQKSLSFHCPTW